MDKYQHLQQILKDLGSVVVAFSGGVDSSLLLKVAHDTLGDGAIAVTAVSASLPVNERTQAEAIARHIGARHAQIASAELSNPQYLANTPQRCFFCKTETYTQLADYARRHGFQAIVDGSNADDAADFRPGRQAAQQHGVRSPLLEAGLNKLEIRTLARQLGLPNWDKPSAPCLSSRIPYGTSISLHALAQVEQAEAILRALGLRQARVRHHDLVARIEAEPADFRLLLERRAEIVAAFKAIGYAYVALDLAGFRSGSLNETLPAKA